MVFYLLGALAFALATASAPEQHEGVVKELNTHDFNTSIGSLPSGSRVLAEYYAGWCPHCRHYAHTYEQIASFFAANEDSGVVAVRVDCAVERRLCTDFHIASYPTIAFGTPEQFLARANVTIHPSSESRDTSSVVAWVGRLMGKPFDYGKIPATKPVLKGQEWLDSHRPQQLQGSQGKQVVPQSNSLWTLPDVELATVELFRQIMSTPPLHTGPDKRSALFQLLRWWSAAHPSGRCRGGAQKLVALFDAKWWPASEGVAPEQLQKFEICGPTDQLAGSSWQSCRGSLPNTRGFTCGLWLLFHTSSTRLPENGGGIFVEGIRAFGNHFFMCGVCQEHFTQIIASPGPLDAVHTREDSMQWAWRTHNQVNARLAAFESEAGSTSGADPMFPKIQFPDAKMCPSCWKHTPQGDASIGTGSSSGDEWDEGAVLVFLDRVYGDDGSQDDGLDDGDHAQAQNKEGSVDNAPDPANAQKEGSSDSAAGQLQVELGRRGGKGFGSSSGNQEGGDAGVVEQGGAARVEGLNEAQHRGKGSNNGGLEDQDSEEEKGESSNGNSSLAGDLGSGWVVLVWLGCALGVLLLVCYLLVPQRKGRWSQGFGSNAGGQGEGGGLGGKRGEAVTHGTYVVGIGSNGNGSARMRNGNGVSVGAARTEPLPKSTF